MISRGIIEKHQVTIPLRKIQAIKIKENIIRQLFGFVTVSIVSAGGGDREKEEGALTILFPMIHKKASAHAPNIYAGIHAGRKLPPPAAARVETLFVPFCHFFTLFDHPVMYLLSAMGLSVSDPAADRIALRLSRV